MTTTHTTAAVPVRPPASAPPNRGSRPPTIMVATIAAVTAVDLAIKFVVAASIPAGDQRGLLSPMTNPEFALGIAGAHHAIMVALMALGVAAAMAVAIPLVARGRVHAVAAGLTIGGALANTVDRAVNGAVQDYLVVGHIVLNLADAAVVIGMATAGYTLLRTRVPHTDSRG
jgi:lipoprotein signal peptidase